MTRTTLPRQIRTIVDELANALQGVAGLATLLRRNTQTAADDTVALEAAVGRAVSALKRLQPPRHRRRTL
jgi:hypothetical protein